MFKLKYLKYKKKYLNLKNLKIGGMNALNNLHMAILNNDGYIARELIRNGTNLEAEFEGKTPLILAIENDRVLIATELIQNNANLEAEFEGKTPLIIAVENNRDSITRTLIENGADKEAQFNGKTPLIIAIENNRFQIARDLIENGANTEVQFNEKTPLLIAIENNRFEIARVLLNNNGNPNLIDINSGDSVLFIAVKLNFIQLVNLLLERRANIFFSNDDNLQNQGKTIFEYIIDNNIQQIITLDSFRRIQALVNVTNQYRIPDDIITEILGYENLDN
jgi:ankyrin repeat protein